MTHEFIGDRAEPELRRDIEVAIPGRPPNTNDSNRQVPQEKWRIRREWRQTAGQAAEAHRLEWERRHGLKWEPLNVATLDVTFVLPDARRRDLDNLVSSLKPLLDGAVDAKLIADDSITCLCEFFVSFRIRRGVTATVLRFREPIA